VTTAAVRTGGRRLARADARLFRRLVSRRSPATDRAMWVASRAANRSLLWLATAALLAGAGGRRGRRAAARGLLATGLASAVANGPMKLAWRRRRPRVPFPTRGRAIIATPRSSSFPSGHAASAAAFATAAGLECPALALPLGALAATVAYSRVHTGVHYPGDVLAGAAVGVAAGLVAARLPLPLPGSAASSEGRPSARAGSAVPTRAVLLWNPRSGAARRLPRAREALLEAGIEIAGEIPIDHHERLADWVSQAPEAPLLVVAAGGDGTVGTATDYVAGTEAVLGVLPLGTSNDFARSLGLPTDPVEAARLLAAGEVTTVDAGRIVVPGEPARHFAHAATVGLNVSFARLATKASLRRRLGRLTYALAGAAAVRECPAFRCELRYGGHVDGLETVHLSIINAPVFGGFLGLRVRGASLDDRVLDVIAVERLPLHRLLLAGLQPILGVRRPLRGIRTLQVPHLRVHSDQDLEVALDGEIRGRIPADFEVAGAALRVVTRPDSDGRAR
jgi:YegS/Rv2252/BmrU family lipid kinase